MERCPDCGRVMSGDSCYACGYLRAKPDIDSLPPDEEVVADLDGLFELLDPIHNSADAGPYDVLSPPDTKAPNKDVTPMPSTDVPQLEDVVAQADITHLSDDESDGEEPFIVDDPNAIADFFDVKDPFQGTGVPMEAPQPVADDDSFDPFSDISAPEDVAPVREGLRVLGGTLIETTSSLKTPLDDKAIACAQAELLAEGLRGEGRTEDAAIVEALLLLLTQ